jgi:hypothetical protein
MTFCEFCGEKIGYLPFKCKYCGGTYCKKHRLPENHQCSFELKHTPLVPTESVWVNGKSEKQDSLIQHPHKDPKELRRYLKRQEKYARRLKKKTRETRWSSSRTKGTFFLIITLFIFSIVAMILSSYGLEKYIYFSLHGIIYDYTYHTIITSFFISSYGDYFGFFLFVISLFFLYFITRNIEMSFGTKFVIKLYLLSCLSAMILFIMLRVALISLAPLSYISVYTGFAWGGLYGLMAYFIFPNTNQKFTTLMMFLPIRMKGRTFLLIIILIRLVPGLILALSSPLYLLYYIPDLGGILASYLIFKYEWRLN